MMKFFSKNYTPLDIHALSKQAGYTTDQNGVMHRYMNERENWESHLNNSRQFIINNLSGIKTNKDIAVLGSGWLLDIPMAFLLENFKTVYLVDICHPQQIVHKYKNQPNLIFKNLDLTGGMVETLIRLKKDDKKDLTLCLIERMKLSEVTLPFMADFYISVVGLDQLGIFFIDYLKQFKKLSQQEEESIYSLLQLKHLEFLQNKPSILITDIEELMISRKTGDTIANKLVFTKLPDSQNTSEWIWKFDNLGKYYPGYNVSYAVKAFYYKH
jgi:hypothetical protein